MINYEVFNNPKGIKNYEFLVYGAGRKGHVIAKCLNDLGCDKVLFADRKMELHGKRLLRYPILNIYNITNLDNKIIIIAIVDKEAAFDAQKEIKSIGGCNFVAFGTIELLHGMICENITNLEERYRMISKWYLWMARSAERTADALNSGILIFQNGKVGSRSLVETLESVNVPCYHFHNVYFMNDIKKDLYCGEVLKDFGNATWYARRFDWQNEDIRLIFKGRRIITAVRDPMTQAFSMIFELLGRGVLNHYLKEFYKKDLGFNDAINDLMNKMCGWMFDWFDEELLSSTGIDVYAFPFDKDNGWARITEGDTDILVLQMEKMDDLCAIIGDFVGKSISSIIHSNEASNKDYYDLYKETKQFYRPNKKLVEQYYNDTRLKHFYSEEDINRFKKRWEYHA